MDYMNDPRLNGEHQFNSAKNKDNVCTHLTAVMADSSGSGCAYITPHGTACGNQVVEDGEGCDCADGSESCTYCTACTLVEGKVGHLLCLDVVVCFLFWIV